MTSYTAIRAHKKNRKQGKQNMSGKQEQLINCQNYHSFIKQQSFPSIKISIQIHTVLGQLVIEQ